MSHICVRKLTIIGSDDGLSPGRRQAIIWINAWILSIRTLATIFSEKINEIHTFSFKEVHFCEMAAIKFRSQCVNNIHKESFEQQCQQQGRTTAQGNKQTSGWGIGNMWRAEISTSRSLGNRHDILQWTFSNAFLWRCTKLWFQCLRNVLLSSQWMMTKPPPPPPDGYIYWIRYHVCIVHSDLHGQVSRQIGSIDNSLLDDNAKCLHYSLYSIAYKCCGKRWNMLWSFPYP